MKKNPVRRCAGCGKSGGKSDFVRLVRLPSSEVVFDISSTCQGRSLYFHPTNECFKALLRRRAPEKLMKSAISEIVREKITSYLAVAESNR